MDLLKFPKKNSFWGSIAHIFLNIILAVTIWLSIYITKTPWVAILLVFISKWRTLRFDQSLACKRKIKSCRLDFLFKSSYSNVFNGVDYIIS